MALIVLVYGAGKLPRNGLGLGEEADFEAQNCMPPQNPSADGPKDSYKY